jgi:hypothetical protein
VVLVGFTSAATVTASVNANAAAPPATVAARVAVTTAVAPNVSRGPTSSSETLVHQLNKSVELVVDDGNYHQHGERIFFRRRLHLVQPHTRAHQIDAAVASVVDSFTTVCVAVV